VSIVEDGSSPAWANGALQVATTASFIPAANSLLVAVACGGGGSAVQTLPVTDSLGSTWTLLKRANTNNFAGVTEIWVMDAGASPSARAVTATLTGSDGAGVSLSVKVLTGAAPAASCLGGFTVINTTTAYTISITTTTSGSLACAGLVDSTGSGALTVNGITTAWHSFSDTGNGHKYAEFRATALTGVPGATVIGFTNTPANNQAIVAVEILPAGVVENPAPQPPGRLVLPWHLTLSLLAAQQQRWSTAEVVASSPDYVPQSATARARRTEPKIRRGQFLPTAPATVVAAAPTWVPTVGRTRRPQAAARRGEFLPAPPQQAYPPPYLESRRRPPLRRSGEFLVIPPPPVVTTPPTFIPAPPTRRRPPPLTRRGEILQLPLVGATPAAPPPFPPPYLEQTHTRPAVMRRGRFLTVPLAGIAQPAPASIPQYVDGRRPAVAPVRRRGAFARVVAVIAPVPPAVLTTRRRPRPATRRGQFLPWWPQAVFVPPPTAPWTPAVITRRRFRATTRRPGRFGTVSCTCIVSRPDSAVMSRPSAGTTTYTRTTTARPSSGTDTRPFTGVTEDPCC
jgi:hypothetical protein